jgi:hypothetical protein
MVDEPECGEWSDTVTGENKQVRIKAALSILEEFIDTTELQAGLLT